MLFDPRPGGRLPRIELDLLLSSSPLGEVGVDLLQRRKDRLEELFLLLNGVYQPVEPGLLDLRGLRCSKAKRV